MNVQAMIMAGGEGVRLRPMTCYMPKPLVPLLGEPVMGYSLKLLKTHGITDVGATLWYRPKEIRDAFQDGKRYGVQLRYYEETAPLGTAGSVKMAKDHLRGTFVVLSGDGLTDCDLRQALSFHKEKQAIATLVLKRVNVPLPYGVVMTERDGRISRFIEKPAWSRVFSNLVNTGVYLLEPEIFDHIPDEGAPDFGKDVFPALIDQGLPVYGYETAAYWCDVGDQQAYLRAQQALLHGETAFPLSESISDAAIIDPTARVEGRCWIGPGSVIGRGAVIRDCVIGQNCMVGSGAVMENSCLWDRAAVGEKARLSGCVVCDGAVIRMGAELSSGCALGQGAIVGTHARLLPGVKIWPHLKANPGALVKTSVVSGDRTSPQWTARGVCCETSEEACACAGAFARVTGGKQVMVGHGGDPALAAVVCGALAAEGARVLDTGETTAPILQTLIPLLRLDGGIFADQQQLRLLDRQGLPLNSKQAAAVDQQVLRPEGGAAFAGKGDVIRFSGAEDVYLPQVVPQNNLKPLFSPVAVFCDSVFLRRLAARGLKGISARDVRCEPVGDLKLRANETGFVLSETGETLSVFCEGFTCTQAQKTMLTLWLFYQRYGVLFDLPEAPRAAEQIAKLRPADGSELCARQRVLTGDGLAALLFLCEGLKSGPLQTLISQAPETHVMTKELECRPQDKGRILHALCRQTQQPHTLGEGVRIRHEKGYATIVPDGYRSSVRVVSESGDSEFARELCDFYIDQIRRMTGKQ